MSQIEAKIAELLVGESAAICRVRGLIARLGASELPVLLLGPTGAGKELAARALHLASGRTGDLVAINACALGESMFEAALFGHIRGAFTGAVQDAPGYLREANGGTLFLDEIGELPTAAQAKLLRALETKTYRPIGARRDARSDFRLVTATNRDIWGLVQRGTFRDDLAYRLGGVTIEIPPLRERLDDLPLLVAHFIRGTRHHSGAALEITASAHQALREHTWPGNIRELRHVLDRASRLTERACLTRSDIVDLLTTRHAGGGADPERSTAVASDRRRLLAALQSLEWKTERVAVALGVSRATIYRRMADLGITPPRRQRRLPGEWEALPDPSREHGSSREFAAARAAEVRTTEPGARTADINL